MTAKNDSRARVAAAEKISNQVHAAWTRATSALGGGVSMNGCGIFTDPSELRHKLLAAEKHIQDALRELDKLTLPSNADYDSL